MQRQEGGHSRIPLAVAQEEAAYKRRVVATEGLKCKPAFKLRSVQFWTHLLGQDRRPQPCKAAMTMHRPARVFSSKAVVGVASTALREIKRLSRISSVVSTTALRDAVQAHPKALVGTSHQVASSTARSTGLARGACACARHYGHNN